MRVRFLMALSSLAVTITVSAACAASCSDDIDRMQARIDAKIEAIAAAGPFVSPGIWSGMGAQPTPLGMAIVEQKMGELSGQKIDAVRAAMAEAHAAHAAGHRKACEQTLAKVARLIGP